MKILVLYLLTSFFLTPLSYYLQIVRRASNSQIKHSPM